MAVGSLRESRRRARPFSSCRNTIFRVLRSTSSPLQKRHIFFIDLLQSAFILIFLELLRIFPLAVAFSSSNIWYGCVTKLISKS